MNYDDWKTTDPRDLDPYSASPDEEDADDDLDLDWDSEDPDDPGPERPDNPPALIIPDGPGSPADPGPLTYDPDEPSGEHGDTP